MTKVIRSVEEWKQIKLHRKYSLGFVPTMGALHKGHISLVEKSQQQNDKTVVSIFVNPTQFNDSNDYENYPDTWQQDLEKLETARVDFLFFPNYQEMYPDNYCYQITENTVSNVLCGKSRAGHFTGVLSVVMKLLQLIGADKAYFGKKDYQQYLLIEGMVKAFFLHTEIIGCEIVREQDGLAMSSRNLLLTKEERALAPLLYKILTTATSQQQAIFLLEQKGFRVDYVEEHWQRRFGAVYLGKVRLIDNVCQGEQR